MGEKKVYTLTAFNKGVVQVIDPQDGSIKLFRQRGLSNLSEAEYNSMVRSGILHIDIMAYKEFPDNARILIECEPSIFNCKTKWFPVKFKRPQ